MTPEQTIVSVEPGGLKFRNQIEVSPYHYGAAFERPPLNMPPPVGQQKSIVAVCVSPGRTAARGTAAKGYSDRQCARYLQP